MANHNVSALLRARVNTTYLENLACSGYKHPLFTV